MSPAYHRNPRPPPLLPLLKLNSTGRRFAWISNLPQSKETREDDCRSYLDCRLQQSSSGTIKHVKMTAAVTEIVDSSDCYVVT